MNSFEHRAPPPRKSAASAVVRHYSAEPALRRPFIVCADLWRDVRAARELAWQLFLRDLKANYRQSFLGYVWAFLPPLAWGGMFILLQKQGIVRSGYTGEGYAGFVLTGMVLWQVFVDSLQAPLRIFGQARTLLGKLSFPREALLLSGIGEVLFQFALRIPLLVWALWAGGSDPGWHWLGLPVGVAALVVAGTSLGVILLPVGLLYQDVSRALALVTSFWLLITPVAYRPPTVGLGAVFAQWNPVGPLIATARAWWLGAPLEYLSEFFLISGLSAGALLIGWIGFRIALPHAVARFGA